MLDFFLVKNNPKEGAATNHRNYVFDKPADESNPNHVVAYEQFKLPVPKQKPQRVNLGLVTDSVTYRWEGTMLNVNVGKVKMLFDSKTGHITSIKKDGKAVVLDGPQLNFWRPPTDNDHVDGHGELLWRRIGFDNLTWTVESIKESKSDNGIIITLERNAKNENGELVLSTYENYQVMRSGDIRINFKLIKSEWVPSFPKIGVQMKVSDEMVNTEWVGYAQETYQDRQACGFLGHYEAPTDDLFHQYVRPQAAGNRMQTRYVSLFNKEHERILSARLLYGWWENNNYCQFSIYPYDDKNIEQAKHINELNREEYYTLNIDYAQAGLGTATCGPDIADRDLVQPGRTLSIELLLQVGENEFFEDFFVNQSKDFYSLPTMIINFGQQFGKWKTLTFLNQPTAPYDKDANSLLIDKKIGNPANFHEGWVGYYGNPMGIRYKNRDFQSDSLTVTLSFAHHPSQWVFLPQKVLVSYSKDGIKYSQPEEVMLPFDPTLKENDKAKVCILRHKIPNKKVKYIKIEAQPVEKLPEWHAAAGEKAWIMVDEVKIR